MARCDQIEMKHAPTGGVCVRQYISGKFAARAGRVQKINPLGADPDCIAFKFKNINNTCVVQFAGAVRR
jgi:hypothetical protein